jgi:hypothetical protein
VIHDEDRVIGFQPADQSEHEGLAPAQAANVFFENFNSLYAILGLVQNDYSVDVDPAEPTAEPAKYRTGTAFIMMWMDVQHPELIDVADTVGRYLLSLVFVHCALTILNMKGSSPIGC